MRSLITSIPVHQTVELLKLEADAINQAAQRLQLDQLERALTLLANCQGKIVLTGVGKSGIVAQKIAATLNSIGIVSVYLHPCDALHGDLGIVTASDVIMLLSNSGETEELVEMIPHLKHRRVPMIAILGNIHSTIADRADAVLDATVDREACPLNLAPTTSTTVALAIGDALAMTLMQMRGITPEDFAVNHPAGRLGKRLTLKVGDLMCTGSENFILHPQASWIEVVSAITLGGSGAVNIVDEKEQQLVGLITDGDLRRWIQKTKPAELQSLNAGRIMTANPVTVTPDILAYDALKLMEDRPSQISVLPVVNAQQHCLGLIRLHDIIRVGL
ncbi:SIS domain-containing protein [Scytonema sp. NUACC26]|uniref:KpsF/GutQ family sugar-phosphate isomerase n=1 Tax=Scytonema sp. NUACC26 TaxID=3140176 RepID=UPI0034DC36E5